MRQAFPPSLTFPRQGEGLGPPRSGARAEGKAGVMADLRLTLACGDYDRTRALIDGRVRASGIDLTVLPISNAWERHQRMIRHEEFDVCELSLSSFLMARDRGQTFVGIPVFPYRMFRHSYLWCGNAIRSVGELDGRRIGVGMYQITTAVWLRGHLQHDYGLAPGKLRWVTAMPELVPFTPPPGVEIEVAGAGNEDLEEKLLAGKLDAYVGVEGIPPGYANDARVHRLFGRSDEQEYFRRTGVFPIMHVIAFRQAVVDAAPWAAVSLLQAFRAAKAWARDYNRFPRVASLAWTMSYQEDEQRLLGSDPYPYDLPRNRVALETGIAYSLEQGLITRAPAVEELFVSGALDFPEA
jgi:4,5-dihydroxyphthalate decarboxylase